MIAQMVSLMFSDKAKPVPTYDEIVEMMERERGKGSSDSIVDDTDRLISDFGLPGMPPVTPKKPQVQ